MTSRPGHQPDPGGAPLDLAAVARDDALLDAIAARRPLVGAPASDPLLASLAALAADVDVPSTAGLPGTGPTRAIGGKEWTGRGGKEWTGLGGTEGPVGSAEEGVAVLPLLPPSRRRLARAVVGAAAVAGVVLASGGAAAAAVITGDPLTPVRAAVHAVLGGSSDTSGDAGSERSSAPVADPTPPASDVASVVAQADAGLAGIGALLARGDVAAAQQQLSSVLALVDGRTDLPPGLQRRLEHLQDRLGNAGEVTGPGAHGAAGTSAGGRSGDHRPGSAGPGAPGPGHPRSGVGTDPATHPTGHAATPPGAHSRPGSGSGRPTGVPTRAASRGTGSAPSHPAPPGLGARGSTTAGR